MSPESRRALRYPFTASAEIIGEPGVRIAQVKDLSLHGCYLALVNPFPVGVSILVKIRTEKKFFQARAVVAHSTNGSGMGLTFQSISPPFRIVLQEWFQEALARTYSII